jgi:hypothetical protein
MGSSTVAPAIPLVVKQYRACRYLLVAMLLLLRRLPEDPCSLVRHYGH